MSSAEDKAKATKQSSAYLSTMASKYMKMTDDQLDEAIRLNKLAVYRNFRSMAASVVSQDETKGQ